MFVKRLFDYVHSRHSMLAGDAW